MLLLFSLVTCSPCGYGQICLAVICLGYKQNECQNVPKPKIWGKSLEKVKKMSVNAGTTHLFAVDAACYNQVALANKREGGNFCTAALLPARVGYSCKVVAQSAGAKPMRRLVRRPIRRLVAKTTAKDRAAQRQLGSYSAAVAASRPQGYGQGPRPVRRRQPCGQALCGGLPC